jgi:hypothetical protein
MDGFKWVDARALANLDQQPSRYLVGATPYHVPQRIEEYSPFKHRPALFKQLAEAEPTETGILTFANRHGLLGPGELLKLKSERTGVKGEPLAVWTTAIGSLRELLCIWELARKGNQQALAEWIRWEGGAAIYRSPHGGWEIISSQNVHAELLGRFTPGDLVQPALYFLQRAVNTELERHTTARLLWDASKLVMRISAKSLIGAIWLQLARAIEGGRDHRQCQYCRNWIEVGGNRTARADSKFCSATCKANAHRRKKEEVRRLYAAGKPVREIADQMGVDDRKIREWTKKGA